MTSRAPRLLLLEDVDGNSLNGSSLRPPASNLSAPRSLKGEIVQLPHPKSGRRVRYLCTGPHVLELQRMSQPLPCSWFVDQTVHADGSLLVASRVDPVFFLLPRLCAAGAPRFSPLAQYLAPVGGGGDDGGGMLASVTGVHAACAAVCDVNNVMGDAPEELLYRLNRAKAAGHLAARVRRLAATLASQVSLHQSRLRAAMGSFSAASEAVGAPGAARAAAGGSGGSAAGEGGVAMEHLLTALGILSDYIDDAWTEATADELAVPLGSILPRVAAARAAAAAAAASSARAAAASARAGADEDDGELDLDAEIERQAALGGGAGGQAAPGPPEDDHGAAPGSGSKAAQWNAAALDDPNAIIAKFVRPPPGGSAAGGGSATKKPAVTTAQATQAKKLAASAKGTPSLMSMFGKAPKK